MKKSFIAVLILLTMVVAFCSISCEKDKSGEVIEKYEEMIKNFEEYQKSLKVANSFQDAFFYTIEDELNIEEGEETRNETLELSEASEESIRNLILPIIGYEYENSLVIVSKAGQITGKSSLITDGIEKALTSKEIEIKYKENDEKQEKTISLSVNLALTETLNEDVVSTKRVYSNIKINEINYGDITIVETNNLKTGKLDIIEAKIGNKSVDLRLIKATI